MTTETGERRRRKTARRAVRDYRNCVLQLGALQRELGPPRGTEWVQRSLGQFEKFIASWSLPLGFWPLNIDTRRRLRKHQRIIRRYDIMLKKARTLNRKAIASLERLQGVMRPRETVRDVLWGRSAGTH